MSRLDDPTLRDRLERRVESSTLNAEQRDQILTAVAAGRPAPRRASIHGTGGRWIGFAAAALGLILVAAVVLGPRNDQGPATSLPAGSAIASSPGTSEPGVSPAAPTAPAPTLIASRPEVLSTEQLAAAVSSSAARGQIVLADVSVAPMPMPSTGEPCPVAVACQVGEIAAVDFEVSVMVGWRHAPDGEGTFSEAEKRWLVRLGLPSAKQHVMAFRVGDHLVEYLGPIVKTDDGDKAVWYVGDVKAGEHADPASDLYAVEGWLVKTSPAPCRAPPDYVPNTDTSYWCGGSFLTATRVVTRPNEQELVLDPGGLHVQWDAYDVFAPSPAPDAQQGAEPRFGTYLVRSAGCPPAVMGECPVWSMVGRLDQLEASGQVPPPGPRGFPAEIDGEAVLTTDEARARVLNTRSAEQFLLGGWVLYSLADCSVPLDFPDTPLLAPCDDGFNLRSEPYIRGDESPADGVRLVVNRPGLAIPTENAGEGPTVLRVHANDRLAAECPLAYRTQCEIAIVVDEVVWPEPRPTAEQAPGDGNDEPTLSVGNWTSLRVRLYVSGMDAAILDPGEVLDPISVVLPRLPWQVEATTTSGRVLLTLTVRERDAGHSAARVDLSCGRIDIWSGLPLAGPVPRSSFPPRDCDP